MKIIKENKLAYRWIIERGEITELLNYIDNLESVNYLVEYKKTMRNFKIIVSQEDYSFIIKPDLLALMMDEEEIRYMKDRLISALNVSTFYPAELCERKAGKGKELATIYVQIN